MSKTIIFLRHAQSISNNKQDHGPQHTIPLSEAGFKSVEQLPEKLLALDWLKPEAIFYSKYIRTRETAVGVEKAFPTLPIAINEYAHEFYAFDLQDGETISHEMKKPIAKLFWEKLDPNMRLSENSETSTECQIRTEKLIESLLKEQKNSILCVSHGHMIRRTALYLCGRTESTPDNILAVRYCKEVENLDMVKMIFDNEHKLLLMQHYAFLEDYKIAHPYPTLNPKTAPEGYVLY
jgi:broad specificity phosphatase PhoE